MAQTAGLLRVRGRRVTHVATAAVLACTLGLAACSSGSKQTPAQAVDSALTSLGQQSSLEIKLTLPITESQVQQIEAKSGGGSLSSGAAKALTTGSVFLTEQTGHGEALDSKTAFTDTSNSYAFGLTIGADTPLELRYLGQNLYLHVQADQLLSDIGESASADAGFKQVLQEGDAYVPGLSALAGGQWVEVSHSSLAEVGNLLKSVEQSGASNGSAPAQSQVQQVVSKFRTQLVSALQQSTTVAAAGSSAGRSEYTATMQVHSFLSQVEPAVQQALSGLGSAFSTVTSDLQSKWSQLEAKVPAGQTAVADLYVSSGHLVQASVDVNQFAGTQKMPFPVPLTVSFSSPPVLSPPAGATQLDLSKLPSLLQGLSSQLGASSSSTSS